MITPRVQDAWCNQYCQARARSPMNQHSSTNRLTEEKNCKLDASKITFISDWWLRSGWNFQYSIDRLSNDTQFAKIVLEDPLLFPANCSQISLKLTPNIQSKQIFSKLAIINDSLLHYNTHFRFNLSSKVVFPSFLYGVTPQNIFKFWIKSETNPWFWYT